MAIRMVRQPSETPNIENIDDFVGLRYAYSNQDGYIAGRGEFGRSNPYTINGSNFIINSGRLVLQGVEVDIENEESITIDISATKRYYAVYLEVNLASNSSAIVAVYDTLGTPSVDLGENLTANPVGVARMVLFTFEATNGIITNVVQVVEKCEYSIPYKLGSDGILRYGDIIIPQRKVLWSNENGSSSASWIEELKIGDTVEITYSLWLNRQVVKGTIYQLSPNSISTQLYVRADYGYMDVTKAYQTAVIGVGKNRAQISRLAYGNHDYPADPLIYKVVKVVE